MINNCLQSPDHYAAQYRIRDPFKLAVVFILRAMLILNGIII